MALSLPFLNRIVSPLARLTVQTRRLVERNFNADQEMHAELLKVSENRDDEVGYLGGALYSMVTTLKTYIADLKATTAAKERIEGELSAARNIQMGMLPDSFVLPDHAECDLHAVLEPAKAVGGDLFDFFLLDEHRLFFLIGDVSVARACRPRCSWRSPRPCSPWRRGATPLRSATSWNGSTKPCASIIRKACLSRSSPVFWTCAPAKSNAATATTNLPFLRCGTAAARR